MATATEILANRPPESPDVPRAPLGLPPGSVRAILSILIAAQLWILVSLPNDMAVPIPLNLFFMLALVMIFFLSHGKSISHSPGLGNPLYLPRGTIRFLLIAGTVGIMVYQYQFDKERLMQRLTPTPDQLKLFPNLLGATALGFIIGLLLRPLVASRSPFLQTLIAWFSILAGVGMFIEVMLHCFVYPHIEQQIDLPLWQCVLTGTVACYFSIRS